MSDDIVDAVAEEIGTDLELRQPAALNLFQASDPAEVIVKATATAKPLADVIRKQKLYKTIQKKNHVLVEGWTLLGSMLGVFPVVMWTKQVDGGWEARVEARTMGGVVVGAAEAQCLRKETRWSKADDYAIRSMAQTRATSRALRGPLGFVIQLAGFQPEPAEDMPEPPAAPKPRGGRGSAGEPSGSDAHASVAVDESTPEGETSASPAESSGEEPAQSGSVCTDGAATTNTESAPVDAASSPDDSPDVGPPASGESSFKAPTGPRGGQSTLIEAAELGEELARLCEALGAVDSLPMVEEKAKAGDTAWLKRQIATASKAVARQEQGE